MKCKTIPYSWRTLAYMQVGCEVNANNIAKPNWLNKIHVFKHVFNPKLVYIKPIL
jgi:hypothetical protein